MDWLQSFYDKFKDDKDLQHLRANKFHGSLLLNFANGVTHATKITRNIKPSSTLKEGE